MADFSNEHVGGYHITQLNHGRCLRLVQSNGNLLPQIPKQFRTNKVLCAAVKSSPKVIRQIPANEITSEMYEIARSKDPSLSGYNPNKIFTYGDYLTMFRNKEIPLEMLIDRTPEENKQYVCSEVAAHNIFLFHQIPEKFRTKKMFIKAIKAGIKNVQECIPKEFMDQEMYEILSKESCIKLSEIPDEFLNTKIAETFLHLNACYMPKLPERLITKELIIKCICKYRHSLIYIPKHKLDEDIYKIHFAVSKDLLSVPTEYWTEDMVMFYYVNKNYLQKPLHFDRLPDSMKTYRVRMLLNGMY